MVESKSWLGLIVQTKKVETQSAGDIEDMYVIVCS